MFLVAGCAAPQPSLYPNAYLQQVGEEVSNGDIEECREMAINAGATPSQERAGRRYSTAARGALLGEFFVDGLDEFVEVEGFFEDAAGAEEFGYVEKVLIPLRAGHGDDLRVEILPCQL